jgi:DNA repair protein SbcD/Mre11
MIKFFHTADVHFGVENYGRVDSKTGLHSRFSDFVNSFETCVDLAISKNIDFFLFCGDAYKTAYPTPTQQKQFLRLLFKLQQAKIPIIIIVGNHDHPLSFGKSHALDVFSTVPLEGIHVFSKPEILLLETKNGPIQIVGIPWPLRQNLMSKEEHHLKTPEEITSYISQRVGIIIRELASQLDKKIPSILAGHLTVGSALFSGSEKCAIFGSDPTFLVSQLAIEPFDYVALGHLHRHQDLNKNSYPSVVYSGSIERIDFGERNEKKGFCEVSIDPLNHLRCSYVFHELRVRPMIQIEVQLDNKENATSQILSAIKAHNIDGAIVKIIYHIPDDSGDKVDLYEIQNACAKAICIASITPVRKHAIHERRIKLNVSMDFESIVEKYLDSTNDLSVDKRRLKEKAFQLYNEVQNEVSNN